MQIDDARQLKAAVRADAARALLSTASALVMADGDSEAVDAVPGWEGVAVLFAGSSYRGAHRTFANPIETVLGTLGVELMTCTPRR